jgi:alpha-glucosidase
VNVQSEDADRQSILTLHRRLLTLRRSHLALAVGKYEPVVTTGHLLAYVREAPDQRLLVALNFGEDPYELSLDSLSSTGRVLLSTHLDREAGTPLVEGLGLRGNEGVIVELSGVQS